MSNESKVRMRPKYGLNDDWICDDHGTFGCVDCMNQEQWDNNRRVKKP